MRLNRIIGTILIFILGFFFFQKPQLVTAVVPYESKWQYEMPVAWLEKRDEALEYWLQNQKKK
jgi:hypothetical protein